MRPFFLLSFAALAVCVAVSTPALAARHDADGYPLRVHILKFASHPRNTPNGANRSDSPDYMDGMGVADLFENGDPQGFTFSYSCIDGIKASGGYGTFPARWKKKDKTIEVLIPETGKPQNLETCELHTEMRPGLVFYWRDGTVAQEAATILKQWMTSHHYDPENGRVDPIMSPEELAAPDSSNTQILGPE
jgi:hypothetical protein